MSIFTKTLCGHDAKVKYRQKSDRFYVKIQTNFELTMSSLAISLIFSKCVEP